MSIIFLKLEFVPCEFTIFHALLKVKSIFVSISTDAFVYLRFNLMSIDLSLCDPIFRTP